MFLSVSDDFFFEFGFIAREGRVFWCLASKEAVCFGTRTVLGDIGTALFLFTSSKRKSDLVFISRSFHLFLWCRYKNLSVVSS